MKWTDYLLSFIIVIVIFFVAIIFTGDAVLSLSITILLGYVEFRMIPVLKNGGEKHE